MPARIDFRRAVFRSAASLLAAVVVAGALWPIAPPLLAVLGGWVTGGAILLALCWSIIFRFDAARTRKRAASEDPGRTATTIVVLVASSASLVAATALVHRAASATRIALCLATAALAWALTHTMFALRYAHLYYREDREGVGGVEFPGGREPEYFDFAYLAFTVGMTFQVSDTSITSPQIRRAVLLQGLMAFFYNTAILAFVLNLVFSLATQN